MHASKFPFQNGAQNVFGLDAFESILKWKCKENGPKGSSIRGLRLFVSSHFSSYFGIHVLVSLFFIQRLILLFKDYLHLLPLFLLLSFMVNSQQTFFA